MFRKIVLFALLAFITLVACKPYNSDEVNFHLLQGKWMKVDYYYMKDSTFVQTAFQDTIILTFRNDSLFEYFLNSKEKSFLKFKINNYRMLIYRNDSLVNWLYIDSLSQDSMLLRIADMSWKYKKIEQ